MTAIAIIYRVKGGLAGIKKQSLMYQTKLASKLTEPTNFASLQTIPFNNADVLRMFSTPDDFQNNQIGRKQMSRGERIFFGNVTTASSHGKT